MVKQLTYNGKSISYSVSGNGSTIVFLHGFLEDSSIWDAYYNQLKNSFNILTVDLPGFGKSDIIEDTHSMELMAKIVIDIIKAENILEFVIVGHSMGGYVGLSMIRSYYKGCRGIVLLNSQAAADDEIARKNRDRTVEIVNRNHSQFISNFIPTLFKETNIVKFRDEIEVLTESSLRTSDEGIIAALLGMKERSDSLNLIRETEIPILFIVGKHDSKIPLEKMKEQIILPKTSESLILDNVGHMAFIEEAELCLVTIKNFAQKHF